MNIFIWTICFTAKVPLQSSNVDQQSTPTPHVCNSKIVSNDEWVHNQSSSIQ